MTVASGLTRVARERMTNNEYTSTGLRASWRVGHADGFHGNPRRPDPLAGKNYASAYQAGYKVGEWKRGLTGA